MSEFAEWDSFYVIVGSAAGALIGLQFVVLTLIAERPPLRAVTPVAALWGLVGLSGAVYTGIVARRMRVQTTYGPVWEDWVFHFVLPSAAYAILALSAFAAPSHTREALFGVGTAALLLLFVGIHNAWDAIAYHVFVRMRDASD